MPFDISDLPDPENRSAAHWVTYYLQVENAVAMGQTVEVGNQKISHHNISTIVNLRKGWEQRVSNAASLRSSQ